MAKNFASSGTFLVTKLNRKQLAIAKRLTTFPNTEESAKDANKKVKNAIAHLVFDTYH